MGTSRTEYGHALVYFLLGSLFAALSSTAFGACEIRNTDDSVTAAKADPLYRYLQKNCATRVQDLKKSLTDAGFTVQPRMVANRGYHNPKLGSFSFFEEVTGKAGDDELARGEFFFGHFTGVDRGEIVLDQAPEDGKLLIEAISRDPKRKAFHFYELIGTATSAQWFYRGDSFDVLRHLKYLYRTPPRGTPKFARDFRCVACHLSGGPILKELDAPHNDWWTKARKLPFGPLTPSDEVKTWLKQLDDVSEFRKSVIAGMEWLDRSETFRAAAEARSLAEQLRPLFCEQEINLRSDDKPFGEPTDLIRVPSEGMVNAKLATLYMVMKKDDYRGQLKTWQMRFGEKKPKDAKPDAEPSDADHAWLTPVRSYADQRAIELLIERKTIDEEFALDVLAVDFARPLFSNTRCELLARLPEKPTEGWRDRFLAALRDSELAGAKTLVGNLTDDKRTGKFHREQATKYLEQMQLTLGQEKGIARAFEALLDLRRAAFAAEISKHPRGQILEPGFRIIFPEPERLR